MSGDGSILDRSDSYCVIGAGPAGMLAARSLKHAGIPYEQFDKNDDVGGIWDIKNDWSPMYESAHFISSKTVSNLPGFEMPEDYPDYPNHREILAYVRDFARAYDLYPKITFEMSIERVEPEEDGRRWLVTFGNGETRRYRGLFLCSGNTWDPNMPDYPGEFTGEMIHAVRYRDRKMFSGKRVLVVGGGNSGCDIACDAALYADEAYISLRRGYHFIPKHIFGIPADKFAGKIDLPRWIERPMFELLLRLVVGDLTNFGLPKPDHPVMASHPIMNTQLLHYLGHGDIEYRPDIERFEGRTVHFKDGSNLEVDLIVFATGYKVTYPYMDKSLFDWISKYPDLYLSSLHRKFDNVCCLGIHQTDGGAYDFFMMQADMMCNFILDQDARPKRAAKFHALKETDRPNFSGGIRYVDSPRHATYVKKGVFRRYSNKLMRKFKWKAFGTMHPPAAPPPEAPRSQSGRPRTSAASESERSALRAR
ncbi:MAG: NAD(P)/FAD-dependent oxidoreductase [Deltaproteobacteria bacterium]|nr:NAD(P)/FAD-dependent oxidoreductase [Deltaproteobacteria bacterium]